MRVVYTEEKTTEFSMENYEITLTGLNKQQYIAIKTLVQGLFEGLK